jgi:hypothetical protein
MAMVKPASSFGRRFALPSYAMNSIVFDTHAAAGRFKRAGFSDDQVEALVEITRETTALPDISTLATKADLAQLEARMDSRFGQMEAKIANNQVQTLTIMISATAVIVTLATVLSRLIH